jgi:integrase
MARAGRKDRGLLSKKDAEGRIVGWMVRLHHEGRERRFGSFTTKTEARDFYEKAKQEQKQGKFFPERYQHGGYDLVEETLDRYMAGNTNKSRKEDERYCKWWKARLAGKRLNHITAVVLDEAKQVLLKKEFAPQTVLHYLKFLRHVLNLSVRDGKLERSPFVRVELPKVTANRTRYLTPDEETKVLKALGLTYGPWARLSILTGMRKSEQFNLRWTDVDMERGLVTLPQTKAGGVQYVHLNDEAKAILRNLDSWQRSVWVFPSENPARPIDGRNFYGRVWMPAVEKAKIEWATWHDLRHTFASRLAMNGATEGTIAALLRHSSTALVRRYAHLSPSHLQAAVAGIMGFGKATVEPDHAVSEKAQEAVDSIPTVTETGKAEPALKGEGA